jgi:hypothetical protein
MLARFGHIIPWILVIVLGILALSIVVMYRTLLFEGFEDTDIPPSPPNEVERTRAINDIKTSVAGATPDSSVDIAKEVNQFILKSMRDMITIYKEQPEQINKLLGKTIDLTDDTCYIMNTIHAKYTKQSAETKDPKDSKEKPSLKAEQETQSRQKKYDLQKRQFIIKDKQDILECFVDEQDISGYSFGSNKTSKSLKEDKYAEDNKQIKEANGELTRLQEQVEAIMDSADYKSAISELKKVPSTAEFVSEFITKNKQEIVEEYKNPMYTISVPYKDSEINETQKEYLKSIDKARDILDTLQTDLGNTFNTAVKSYTKLVTDFKTVDSSYKESYRP